MMYLTGQTSAYFTIDYTPGNTTAILYAEQNAFSELGAGPHSIPVQVTDGGGLLMTCTLNVNLAS
jgi:hypothetical protein